VKFRKDPFGKVWVRGFLSGGAADTTLFFLPLGYRPPLDFYYDLLRGAGAAGGYVLVRASDGAVVPHTADGYVDLSFDTETVGAYASGALGPPVVTSLPKATFDGQECLYRFVPTTVPASTIPLLWHLRYDQASTLWLPVGEPKAIWAEDSNSRTSGAVAASTWTNVHANDPNITAPLAGTYDIENSCQMSSGATIATLAMGCRVEPTNPVAGADSTLGYPGVATAAQSMYSSVRKALAASALLRQFYWQNGATQTISRGNAVMKARPVSITPI
jgi:hypothetical protein